MSHKTIKDEIVELEKQIQNTKMMLEDVYERTHRFERDLCKTTHQMKKINCAKEDFSERLLSLSEKNAPEEEIVLVKGKIMDFENELVRVHSFLRDSTQQLKNMREEAETLEINLKQLSVEASKKQFELVEAMTQ